jgi:hypothetical protein
MLIEKMEKNLKLFSYQNVKQLNYIGRNTNYQCKFDRKANFKQKVAVYLTFLDKISMGYVQTIRLLDVLNSNFLQIKSEQTTLLWLLFGKKEMTSYVCLRIIKRLYDIIFSNCFCGISVKQKKCKHNIPK